MCVYLCPDVNKIHAFLVVLAAPLLVALLHKLCQHKLFILIKEIGQTHGADSFFLVAELLMTKS